MAVVLYQTVVKWTFVCFSVMNCVEKTLRGRGTFRSTEQQESSEKCEWTRLSPSPRPHFGSVSVGEGWGMAGLLLHYQRLGCSVSGSRGARWEGEGRGDRGGGGGVQREEDHTWRSHASGTWSSARSANTSQEKSEFKSCTASSSLDMNPDWRYQLRPEPQCVCMYVCVLHLQSKHITIMHTSGFTMTSALHRWCVGPSP